MEPVTLEALASVFGQPVEDFTALFVEPAAKEGEQPKPLAGEAFTTKLQEVFKSETARFYAEGEKRGKRERMSEFEKNVRAKYGATLNQQGEALIDAVVAAKAGELETLRTELEAMKAKPSAKSLKEVDENEAKAFIVNHPFFKTEIEQREAAVKAKEQEFEQFKSEIETRQVLSVVEAEAQNILMAKFRPKLSENPTVAKNAVSDFVRDLMTAAKYKVEDGKGPVALGADGEPVKDENFRQLNFEQWVLARAALRFDPHPVDPNKSAPGANQTAATGSGGVVIPDWSKLTPDQAADHILGNTDTAKAQILSDSYSKFLDGK